jgi:hypothetical protein
MLMETLEFAQRRQQFAVAERKHAADVFIWRQGRRHVAELETDLACAKPISAYTMRRGGVDNRL